MASALLATLVLAAFAQPEPVPLTQPLAPPVVLPFLPAPLPTIARPMSLEEFARVFVPAPGSYSIKLIHPVSKCAVDVCFNLPDGCAKCVKAGKRSVTIDYGRHSVQLVFRVLGGGNRVDVVTR